MNGLEVKDSFDYSILDPVLTRKLKDREMQLNGIYGEYASQVGRVLYEAQQDLADYNNGGLFADWVESKGFKRQRAYEYINIYKATGRISGQLLDVFMNASKSLQIEMSKPSANPEVNEAVFEGDIKTHKEYKEMERRLKEQDKQLQAQQNTIDQQSNAINQLQSQPPKTVTKEVVPSDYEQLKIEVDSLKGRNSYLEKSLQNLYNKRKEVDEKSRKYDELTSAIEKMQGQLTEGQQRIASQKEIYSLVKASEKAISELAPLTYLINNDELKNNKYAKKPIQKIISDLKEITKRLESQIDGQVIIVE